MTSLDDGRVELEKPLGEGGMGTVYRGRLREHIGPVAVKLLRVEGLDPADRPTLAARLRDEAAAAARVLHPNLVRVLAAGDCPSAGPYIVYELVEGGSLEERLAEGPLAWEEVAERLAPQLLGALKALHDSGIVHRDVKPDNIFVAARGRYVLGDLGLAVFAGRSAATATGLVVGTPGYLAPERVTRADGASTPAADVYAAAMVLVRAAAGRLPFTAAGPAALVREQLTRDLSPRYLAGLGLPVGAARVLSAALDRDPTARPASPDDLLAALRTASAAGAEARREGDAPTLSLPRRAPRAVAPPAAGARPRRRGAPLVLALALLLGGLLLAHRNLPWGAEADGPSGLMPGDETLVAQVVAARPLLPDRVTERLLRPDAQGASRSLLVRSVALAAGTTSAAGQGTLLLAEAGRRSEATAVARRYGELLLAAPPEAAAGATALLTELLLTAVPDEGPALDALALTVCSLRARLPVPVRDAGPGRALRLALEAVLVRSTDGGMPPAAREALALTLTDPSLGDLAHRVARALELPRVAPADPTAFLAAVQAMAKPALDRAHARGGAISLLSTDSLFNAARVTSGEAATLEADMAAAAHLVEEDWYRLWPYVRTVEPPSPPAPLPEAWTHHWLSEVALMRRYRVIHQPRAVVPITIGPFRERVLAARLGGTAVFLAERAASGDRVSRAILVRDASGLVQGQYGQLAGAAGVFLDPVEEILAREEACGTALLMLRGCRRSSEGYPDRARVLLARALATALDVVETAGEGVAAPDVDAVRNCMHRLRQEALTPDETVAFRAFEARARDRAAAIRALPGRSADLDVAALYLGEEVGRKAGSTYIGE